MQILPHLPKKIIYFQPNKSEKKSNPSQQPLESTPRPSGCSHVCAPAYIGRRSFRSGNFATHKNHPISTHRECMFGLKWQLFVVCSPCRFSYCYFFSDLIKSRLVCLCFRTLLIQKFFLERKKHVFVNKNRFVNYLYYTLFKHFEEEEPIFLHFFFQFNSV